MEQVIRHHHCRKEHDPPYRRLTMLLGTSTYIHHTGGVSSSPASFLNFHLHDMLTRALYNKNRYRYRYLPVDKIPIFSFYITAAWGLPFTTCKNYFLICQNVPDPPSYKPTSISRHHYMYAKDQCRTFLFHWKHLQPV